MNIMDNVNIPDYLKNAPTSVTDETAQAVLNKLQPTTGGQFIYKAGGAEIPKGAVVNIVILAIAPPRNFVNQRAYYLNPYNSESNDGPICGSPDGVLPYSYVEQPQHPTCDGCAKAVLGSKGSESKAAACSSFKQILAVFPENIEEPFRLKAPVTTLRQFGDYRYKMKQAGYPIAAVITQVSFDPEETRYAKIRFDFAGFLPEEKGLITTKMAASQEITQMISPGGITQALPAPTEQPQAQPPQAQPPQAQPPQAQPPQAQPENPIDAIQDMLNVTKQSPSAEPALFDTLVSKINVTTTLDDLRNVVKTASDDGHLEMLSEKGKLTSINEVILAKQATLKNSLTANTPAELPTVLAELLEKANPKQHIPAFINLCSQVLGETFDPNKHATSATGFPALKKDGTYKVRKNIGTEVKVDEPATAKSAIDALMDKLQ
jgi:hypothetical protein